ncbi:LysM peptidoglycan-binding domain-containing protein [Viridibacillus sp. NPDC096237]|uniref:LysM peptidoglycan-binding domain-containing protein n=1 Tax=Viridibacillus sp. NPDC096237 TaxID=3390721 RepID=UPI003D04FC90
MAQKDYREKIEEHRQTIKLKLDSENNENPSRMTRSQLHGNSKKKRRINPLPTILAVIFISIPISILIYVGFFYDKGSNEETELEKDHVKFETNTKVNTQAKAEEKTEDKKEKVKAKEEKKVNKEKENTSIKKVDNPVVEPPKDSTETNPDNGATTETNPTSPAEAYQQAQASGRLHTVQTGDTLYKIAMKYYGSIDGIAKIKQANGMTSDNVVVGTSLAIPQ